LSPGNFVKSTFAFSVTGPVKPLILLGRNEKEKSIKNGFKKIDLKFILRNYKVTVSVQLSNGYIAIRNTFAKQILAGTFPNKANCKANSFNKIIFFPFFLSCLVDLWDFCMPS